MSLRPWQAMSRGTFARLLMFMSVLLLAGASPATIALALESPWLDGYKSRTRLSAGVTDASDGSRLLAFVEIELPEGWKTYWRNPGDAGGLPPTFDWSKSSNLAAATVLYPAPKLMTDKAGNTIGYKDRVVFPVEIKAKNADEAIDLALTLQFGICKDICVPVEAELGLEIPPKATDGAPTAGLEALARVPREDGERRSGDPILKRAVSKLDGDRPLLTLEASFGADTDDAVIFLEAPDGLYLPLPTKAKDNGGGLLTFEADLARDVDLAALRGKTITATLVGKGGASVASFQIE
jgi:DsbC/DsbD-like thiol-disulfide interchange protein